MSRKALITLIAILVAAFAAIGIAICFLYAGTGDGPASDRSAGLPSVLKVVPSDASLVAYGKVGCICPFDDDIFDGLKRHDMSISMHHSGKLQTLYAFDVRRADKEQIEAITGYLVSEGYVCEVEDDMLISSRSANLLKSAVRHLQEGVSIKDVASFMRAFESAEGKSSLFLSAAHARRLLSSGFTSKVLFRSAFISKVADWCALDIDDSMPLGFEGSLIYDGEPDEFATALQTCTPGICSVADYLPSYTLFALSLPMSDHAEYRKGYSTFADSRGKLESMRLKQTKLEGRYSLSPEDFFQQLGLKELAAAVMYIGGKKEKVILMHIDSRKPELIFRDASIKTLRGYVPVVHEWKYSGFLASVYGDFFALDDESCFTYMDGWLIVGSRRAIDEYVTKDALHYTLAEYASHAGRKDILSAGPALAVAYFSFTAEKERINYYVNQGFLDGLRDYVGQAQYTPAVLYLSRTDGRMEVSAAIEGLELSRLKAPVSDRGDSLVNVPKGPFKVINSKTGKVNSFYQNKHLSLCLRDENGKDLWGVPFDKPICGTAGNVDCYKNGKLQILFGAGSQLYIIDVLGRYVNGYPVDLRNEILIGPQVYDFSSDRNYSLMVLHKDNTVQMYDLRGKKIASWKTISVKGQTIKAMPSLLEVGQDRYWVVRTSIQTLIYPANGGRPLTDFKDDMMIMPDSEIIITEDMNVEVTCYDGKTRQVTLK